MIYRNFEDDLKEGERAEELILSKFKAVIQPVVMRIAFKDGIISRQLQKAGVDVSIQQNSVGFDVKARDYKYYKYRDILFETISVREVNKNGWLYKADIVVYLWWNPTRTRFVDGYVLFLQNIREWLASRIYSYHKKIAFSERNGLKWSTENIAIPITDIPLGYIIQLNKSELLHREQIRLNCFLEIAG